MILSLCLFQGQDSFVVRRNDVVDFGKRRQTGWRPSWSMWKQYHRRLTTTVRDSWSHTYAHQAVAGPLAKQAEPNEGTILFLAGLCSLSILRLDPTESAVSTGQRTRRVYIVLWRGIKRKAAVTNYSHEWKHASEVKFKSVVTLAVAMVQTRHSAECHSM